MHEREKILKKEGLDPTKLNNLTLVYKAQEVIQSRPHCPCHCLTSYNVPRVTQPQIVSRPGNNFLLDIAAEESSVACEVIFYSNVCYQEGHVDCRWRVS